jgi:hypothetical protein
MSDTTDLLIALLDVGVASPAVGDAGDDHVRAALQREINGRCRSGRRIRLPFGTRSIALIPAALLVTAVTAAAAGTVALVNASPTTLFENNPSGASDSGIPHQTVIPSTVRMIDTFQLPRVGPVEYWVADATHGGLCEALRRPDGTWAGYPDHGTGAGQMPGCGPTRAQVVALQGDGHQGLLPSSVDEQSVSMKDSAGAWWDIYFGIVSANGAAGVKDPVNGQTAPLIDRRYFVMVVKQTGNCGACDYLRAIDAAGNVLPANYGPKQYRDH